MKHETKNMQDFGDYEDEDGNVPDCIPQEQDYWIFPVSALIHSGVWLLLGQRSFSCDPGGWDTSHVGAVLVKKEICPEEDSAREAAEGIVKTWNQCLSGDVYGIVKEIYNKDKVQVEYDSCWGFCGYEYAKEALKTEI